MREFARHETGADVTEPASAVGLSRPTAFRILNSLEQTGFVDRNAAKYTLGWEFSRLAPGPCSRCTARWSSWCGSCGRAGRGSGPADRAGPVASRT
ncbi:helix-turn-helix domain-containing protein [Streptomyces boncukensis]|uniref:helix-turn-helix domain-containing protein n=1 Tax=Streptomyces boncukensis TaxID=2711219 RepID=UPI003B96CE95